MNELHTPAKLSKLRANARGQLVGKYPVAIAATVTIGLIRFLFTYLFDINTSTAPGFITSIVISLVIELLLGVLNYGEAFFFLKIARGSKEIHFSDIFAGFKTVLDKSILVQCIFTAFTTLAVIPSVLVFFHVVYVPAEYANHFLLGTVVLTALLSFLCNLYFGLSFYLLVDHNDWTPVQVFKESLYLMKKKKGRYFMICLTSVPLFILSYLACFVGLFWFVAYFKTLLANFYLDTIGEDGFDLLTDKPETPSSQYPSDDSST